MLQCLSEPAVGDVSIDQLGQTMHHIGWRKQLSEIGELDETGNLLEWRGASARHTHESLYFPQLSPTAAHHRPVSTRHVTEVERIIPLWTGSLNMRIKRMQVSLDTPNLLAADVVHALSQVPKGETRRSHQCRESRQRERLLPHA